MKTNLFRNIKLPLLGRGLGGGRFIARSAFHRRRDARPCVPTIARSAFILLLLCCPMVLAAQSNGVKVSNLAVSAGTPSTVTFDVSWNNTGMPDVWSDTVWVWVDYNNNGMMKRLPLLSGATLTATSALGVGKVAEDAGNNQGVWVVGNARDAGAFSATIQLLTALANFSGVCAYASNYPPMGEYLSSTEISFTGTPPYNIVLKANSGDTETHPADSPYAVPPGFTVQSFTDATGAPGTFTCIPSTVYDLQVSASTFSNCEGGAGVIFALSGTDKGASYELYRDGTPEAVATLVGTNSAATFSGTFGAGTYTARTVPGGGFCPADMSGMHEVSELPVPTITTQPAGNSVCSNGTVQLRVVATGATAYQWRKDGSNVTDGSGGTSATYTTAALSANATYTVVVSNAGCSVISSAAPVTRITTETDFTKFTPSPSEPIGMTWCLVDKREPNNNQTYKVRKMPDGRIWMVQDLKFGDCPNSKDNWKDDRSEADTQKKPTVHDGYVGHCRSTTYTNSGFLYNWPAAMQSTKAYYGSTVTVGCSGTATGKSGTAPGACQGICPEGWHIPTGNSGGEFYDLHYNYNRGCATNNSDCWNAFSDWEGVLGGACNYLGTPGNQGFYANYWSSTYYSSDYAYDLYFRNGNTDPGTYSNNKGIGVSVRCLRNY